jgi:predicted peptidase
MNLHQTALIIALGLTGMVAGAEDAAMIKKPATGFIDKTLAKDGAAAVSYVLYVPRGYDTAQEWPLVVFLHGAGERGADGMIQSDVGIGHAIRKNPERFPCLVLMPQCPLDKFWDVAFDDIEKMMEVTRKDYRVDPARVTLTGLSMGGYATWFWGPNKLDLFAALMPICGGGDPRNDMKHLAGDMSLERFGTMEERVAKLATVPIWAFHGKKDRTVPAFRSRQMVSKVTKAGGDVKYTEYPEDGHNSWDSAYGDAEAIAWLLAQRRK